MAASVVTSVRKKSVVSDRGRLKKADDANSLKNKSKSANPAAKKSAKRRRVIESNADEIIDLTTESPKAVWVRGKPIEVQPEVNQPNRPLITTAKGVKRRRVVAHKRPICGRHKCCCGKTYAHKKNLQSHAYVHGKTTFPCSMCDKIYKRPLSLMEHKRQKHNNKTLPTHQCECGKVFRSRSYLRQHSYIHLNTKFPCVECGEQMSNPSILRRHMKQQHPEAYKKLKCCNCGKQFISKDDFSLHLPDHSNNTYSAGPSTEYLNELAINCSVAEFIASLMANLCATEQLDHFQQSNAKIGAVQSVFIPQTDANEVQIRGRISCQDVITSELTEQPEKSLTDGTEEPLNLTETALNTTEESSQHVLKEPRKKDIRHRRVMLMGINVVLKASKKYHLPNKSRKRRASMFDDTIESINGDKLASCKVDPTLFHVYLAKRHKAAIQLSISTFYRRFTKRSPTELLPDIIEFMKIHVENILVQMDCHKLISKYPPVMLTWVDPPLRQSLIEVLVSTARFHRRASLIVEKFCSLLANITSDEDKFDWYLGAIDLLEIICDDNNMSPMARKSSLKLLTIIIMKADGTQDDLFAEKKFVEKICRSIELQLENDDYDDIMQVSWECLSLICWKSGSNQRIFVAALGISLFQKCYEKFHSQASLVSRMQRVANLFPDFPKLFSTLSSAPSLQANSVENQLESVNTADYFEINAEIMSKSPSDQSEPQNHRATVDNRVAIKYEGIQVEQTADKSPTDGTELTMDINQNETELKTIGDSHEEILSCPVEMCSDATKLNCGTIQQAQLVTTRTPMQIQLAAQQLESYNCAVDETEHRTNKVDKSDRLAGRKTEPPETFADCVDVGVPIKTIFGTTPSSDLLQNLIEEKLCVENVCVRIQHQLDKSECGENIDVHWEYLRQICCQSVENQKRFVNAGGMSLFQLCYKVILIENLLADLTFIHFQQFDNQTHRDSLIFTMTWLMLELSREKSFHQDLMANGTLTTLWAIWKGAKDDMVRCNCVLIFLNFLSESPIDWPLGHPTIEVVEKKFGWNHLAPDVVETNKPVQQRPVLISNESEIGTSEPIRVKRRRVDSTVIWTAHEATGVIQQANLPNSTTPLQGNSIDKHLESVECVEAAVDSVARCNESTNVDKSDTFAEHFTPLSQTPADGDTVGTSMQILCDRFATSSPSKLLPDLIALLTDRRENSLKQLSKLSSAQKRSLIEVVLYGVKRGVTSNIQKSSMKLLVVIADNSDLYQRNLILQKLSVKKICQSITIQLSKSEYDDIMEIRWKILKLICCVSVKNQDKFLKVEGIKLFRHCCQKFPNQIRLVSQKSWLIQLFPRCLPFITNFSTPQRVNPAEKQLESGRHIDKFEQFGSAAK